MVDLIALSTLLRVSRHHPRRQKHKLELNWSWLLWNSNSCFITCCSRLKQELCGALAGEAGLYIRIPLSRLVFFDFIFFYLFILVRAFLSVIPAERRILKKIQRYFVDKDRFHQCAKMEVFPSSIPENLSQKISGPRVRSAIIKLLTFWSHAHWRLYCVDKANSLDEDRVDTKASSSAVHRKR